MSDVTRRPQVSLIVAVADNGVIGKDNGLPWRHSEDLKHFKRTTLNKPVIMGRKTWESLPKALPKRRNIVVTRQADYQAADAVVVSSLVEAFSAAEDGGDEWMVIGGAELYRQALPYASKVYLTRIDSDVDGDTFFPELGNEWSIVSSSALPASSDVPAFVQIFECKH